MLGMGWGGTESRGKEGDSEGDASLGKVLPDWKHLEVDKESLGS